MQVVILFIFYLSLILALAVWREHHDTARTSKRQRVDGARGGGVSRSPHIALRKVRGALRRSQRTS
jgi:hypothetical protein